MPTPSLKDDLCREAVIAVAQFGGINPAARHLGIPRSTLQGRLRVAEDRGIDAISEEKTVEYPDFVTSGDDEEPIEELLSRREKSFERKLKAHNARQWFEIKVNETKPYAILAFGDPHLDDDGCAIPILRKHLDIASREGVYSINIGDTHNNWVGRLERLYAHQEASKNTGKRLVEWFMFDSGARWLCWIIGNHDAWNDGVDFHMRLAKKRIPVLDWKAQFKLVHPDGTELRVDASHGRKGSSQWNNLHATLKAAKLGEMADIYFTGHTHNYGLEHLEIAERRHSCWLAQLRGYKFMDHYALYGNFAEHQLGSAVLAVIDPRPDARTKVQCFEDVELGYQFLEALRNDS